MTLNINIIKSLKINFQDRMCIKDIFIKYLKTQRPIKIKCNFMTITINTRIKRKQVKSRNNNHTTIRHEICL